MKTKQTSIKVGDRVNYFDQPKSNGVAVEIHTNPKNGKDVKVHWGNPPVGEKIHRNGRGSYRTDELKVMKV